MVIPATIVIVALTVAGPAAGFAQNVTEKPQAPARHSGLDLTAGVGMIRDSDHHPFAGFRGTAAMNITERFAVIAQGDWLAAFAERSSSGRIVRDNQATALAGIRLRKFFESPAVPYLQLSAGYASRRDNGLEIRRSLFAFRSDGGLEVQLGRHFGVRAGGGWTCLFADVPYRYQLGGTIGMSVFLGKR